MALYCGLFYASIMHIINSIVPIFLLIALGKVLHKTGAFPDSFYKGLNRLVFWIALPAFLISRISVAEIDPATLSSLLLLLTLSTLLCVIIAWLLARVLRLPPLTKGSFIQGSFRSNCAFVGLPVIVYALGTVDPAAETLATVVMAPVVILYNLLSVAVLLHYGPKKHSAGESAATFLLQLIQNPLVIGCAIGFALNLLSLKLPLFLMRPMDALGSAALPVILISIGSSLTVEPLRGAASPSLISSLLKVVVCPLLGFLLAGFFELSRTEIMIALFYLGSPTAGMSYVMAEVMGNDATVAGRIVALSTLLSGITLSIIIALGL